MAQRCAGVLLHPTTLAGEGGLTPETARAFVAWMKAAGLTLWQTLPLNPPEHVSPYQCLTSFALIDSLFAPAWLARLQPLREAVTAALAADPESVAGPGAPDDLVPIATMIARERLHYVLFTVAGRAWPGLPFWQWPKAARVSDPAWRNQLAVTHHRACFARMARLLAAEAAWREVVAIAHDAGVAVIGDLPFFVSAHSADVWGNRCYFLLNDDGSPAFVAGVPPDYFSATGQRWGNPQYDWQALGEDDFLWIRARVAVALGWFDGLRLDHFRGYRAVWAIPAEAPTAEEGRWLEVPGERLLSQVQRDWGGAQLPFIAEDLGIITEEVRALQQAFHLPGISVLQFGFDGLPGNPHAPANIPEWQVAVTGTHDNATTCEWWESIRDEGYRQWILAQLPTTDPMPWPLIDAALASRARWAIIPIADWLALGAEARFNTPGTVNKRNWRWKLPAGSLTEELAHRIHARLERTDRLVH